MLLGGAAALLDLESGRARDWSAVTGDMMRVDYWEGRPSRWGDRWGWVRGGTAAMSWDRRDEA